MKKTILILAIPLLLINMGLSQPSEPSTQITPDDGINLEECVPPSWATGYIKHINVRYYYLPDLEIYYDVYLKFFIYKKNKWIYTPVLPKSTFGNVNLFDTRIIPLKETEVLPMESFAIHRSQFPGNQSRFHTQPYDGNSQDIRE